MNVSEKEKENYVTSLGIVWPLEMIWNINAAILIRDILDLCSSYTMCEVIFLLTPEKYFIYFLLF